MRSRATETWCVSTIFRVSGILKLVVALLSISIYWWTGPQYFKPKVWPHPFWLAIAWVQVTDQCFFLEIWLFGILRSRWRRNEQKALGVGELCWKITVISSRRNKTCLSGTCCLLATACIKKMILIKWIKFKILLNQKVFYFLPMLF